MKKTRYLAAVMLSACAVGWAQAPQNAVPVEDDQSLTIDVDLVNVVFTVTDDEGHYVTSLTADDFTVYEDGVRQEITNFESETNLPLNIGLVIDVSASVREKLDFEREAANQFFYSTLERGRDQALLIAFDNAPRLLQDFTDDVEDLAVGVEKLEAGGTSALYDAVWLAMNARMAAPGGRGRKILIVISDGADTASRKSLDEVLEIAQKSDVSIYAISTNGTANFQNRLQESGEKALGTLAAETGGLAFSPLRVEELRDIFAEISDELRSQYALGYVSSNAALDGSFREIRIEPRDRGDRVKARSGYYARVENPD